MSTDQARAMAAYNRWMNERLYAVCERLSDGERRRDRGAFFKSIHGTLDHLLLADRLWLGRFLGEPFHADALDQQLYEEFHELWVERRKTDVRIVQWANGLSDDILAGELCYTGMVNPAPRRCAMWVAVTHFFNHQTHHRGQLTTLLTQCGLAYGVTDLIRLPDLAP